jgi:hypothetical protein
MSVLLVAVAGCTAGGEQARRHDTQLRSIAVSAKTVGDAWTAGWVSQRYAGSALRQLHQQVERERATLAANIRRRVEPRTAAAIHVAEALGASLAQLLADVDAGDSAAVRRDLARLPGPPRGPP